MPQTVLDSKREIERFGENETGLRQRLQFYMQNDSMRSSTDLLLSEFHLELTAWPVNGLNQITSKVSFSSKRLMLKSCMTSGEISAPSWPSSNGHSFKRWNLSFFPWPRPQKLGSRQPAIKCSQLPVKCRWFLLLQLHFPISSGVYTSP